MEISADTAEQNPLSRLCAHRLRGASHCRALGERFVPHGSSFGEESDSAVSPTPLHDEPSCCHGCRQRDRCCCRPCPRTLSVRPRPFLCRRHLHAACGRRRRRLDLIRVGSTACSDAASTAERFPGGGGSGVPSCCRWSEPGKSGLRRSSSARMQPTDLPSRGGVNAHRSSARAAGRQDKTARGGRQKREEA